MKIYHSVLILLSLIVTSQLIASDKQIDVIYGDDNRVDVYESKNSAFVELSKSTAAMISAPNITTSSSGEMIIKGQTLVERGICAKERFSSQISAANCSGFLVSENVLVTAGHCIKNEADCAGYKWVFDYKIDHADQKSINVSQASVYG